MCGWNEEEMKREERLCWSEKIPEGSVVRRLLLRVNVKRVEERGDDDGMEREWREVREERPVKMEEGREERLLELRYEGREG